MIPRIEPLPRELSGRYTLEREIGQGGMARVFLGHDGVTGDTVAIKVLRPELVASVSAARFHREIRHLRTLRHPNILPLLDSGQEGELLYFSMPYVEGDTLRIRLDRVGVLPLEETLTVVAQLSSALDYAHAHNIVHRDLKPENILFADDRVLLCDFGISRAIVASSTEDMLSSSGVAVGTPSYMSPEQALHGAAVDGRTDIYALGCLTYEMLAGEPPFSGRTLLSLIARHANQAPRSIRSVRPEIPPQVEAAIHAAMAKTVEARPPSAAAYLALVRQA
jgi:serine/threonine-protein kinase